VGQLHVEKPIVHIGKLWPLAVEQELLSWIFTQNPVLDGVFVVDEFQLLSFRQRDRVEVAAQLFLGVIPENNPVALEELGQSLGNSVFHH
jgi:hypothetical protein